MATKGKNKSAQVAAVITLAMIVAAGAEGMPNVPKAVFEPLEAEGMIEVNPATRDAAEGAQVRATEKGIQAVNASQTQTPVAAAVSSGFAIDDGIAMPAASARGRTSTTYPFEALNVGQSFFVPNSEDKPNAAKSLASTVSSATARYAVEVKDANGQPVQETVKVKTYQTDAEGKRVKDAEGHFVVTGETTETRVKMAETRKFIVRAVDETAQGRGPGARVWRTA